ncbi:MAG TPA: hypothetical protein VFU25_06060, partial [Ornithinibacter sp.]|nr:hypothetical protein [Ornithinibacter sp.]
MTDDDPELPTPHAAFAAHFTDALYEDDGDDLAPFGSDEGWDLVTEWGERRDELSAHATVQEVLDESPLPDALEHVGVPVAATPAARDGADAARLVVVADAVRQGLADQLHEVFLVALPLVLVVL